MEKIVQHLYWLLRDGGPHPTQLILYLIEVISVCFFGQQLKYLLLNIILLVQCLTFLDHLISPLLNNLLNIILESLLVDDIVLIFKSIALFDLSWDQGVGEIFESVVVFSNELG